MIKNVTKTVPWAYVIDDINGEEVVGRFYEKELQQINQTEFGIEKVMQRKRDKIYEQYTICGPLGYFLAPSIRSF